MCLLYDYCLPPSLLLSWTKLPSHFIRLFPFYWSPAFIFLKILFIYLFFREKGREGEREGEKYQCAVASHVPPTGDLACNPGTCPDWESNQWSSGFLNPLSYTSQVILLISCFHFYHFLGFSTQQQKWPL